MSESSQPALDAAEVARRLAADLPGWNYRDGAIRRRYTTGGWRATLMAVNTVGHLAEAAWHHPDIAASYGALEVALSTHSARGITEKDFALARKIDAVLLWNPAGEGTLEGPPADHPYVTGT